MSEAPPERASMSEAPPERVPPGEAPLRTVAVCGVGLIGGSVAAGLRVRRRALDVVGFDPAHAQQALAAGLVDRVAASFAEAVAGADLVVLAAPVAANCELLVELGAGPVPLVRRLAPGAAITDVSSTKRSVTEAARRALGGFGSRFVASHPIAGSERHGPSAARADLFEGSVALVCPQDGSDADAVARVQALWQGLGARCATMAPERHDDLFAAVSHWPHAVAFALSASVGGSALADDARRYCGAGLRDTTRVGASSPELWAGILLDNRGPSLAAAAAFRAQLDDIEHALADGDRERLTEALARGARWRRTL